MTTPEEAFKEAERRIEAWQEGETLDLSIDGLAEIPQSVGTLANLSALTFISLDAEANFHEARDLCDLTPLKELENLQQLNCFDTQVDDLTPLKELQNLQQLDCAGTQVDDLTPLKELENLQQLDCSDTQVGDLTPLKELENLRQLNCAGTQVDDLTPLKELENLQQLNCSGTQVDDLQPLKELENLRQLSCSNSQIDDLQPLKELENLQQLNCSYTQVDDLTLLKELENLQQLNCSNSQVDDLTPLKELENLRQLNCSGTQVNDLTPLKELENLWQLNCSGTQVNDLTPLKELQNLQQLDCYSTQVNDLTPLKELENLQRLDCSGTQVNDLTSLKDLENLQQLDCSGTQINDLTPLKDLENLQQLDCYGTQVDDLTPLKELQNLQQLDCSDTQVDDLTPLKDLENLQQLDCSYTQVDDLTPLKEIESLQNLNFGYCRLKAVFAELWERKSIRSLRLYKTEIPGVPDEVLSRSVFDDCLHTLRAHLKDLGASPEPLGDAKLMVLGNGRVGKTQVCRRLRDEAYDKRVPSTHGVILSSSRVPQPDTAQPGRFNIWDFGGQDIYHSTHALFMRSRAVFLIAWNEDMESRETHRHDGMVFRNFPLPYWLQYVSRFGEERSPVLLVQTQCDTPEEDKRISEDAAALLDSFRYKKSLQYSAKTDRGRLALNETLAEAYRQLNQPLIGQGRAAVKRKIEDWRDRDAATLDVAKRKHRTISHSDFRTLCQKTGGISDPELFLQFLHNAGTVFYQSGLFDDQIIIDQGWALDAIYAVFHRDSCYRLLENSGGRFTRSLLGSLLWDAPPFSYTEKEQELFISMMETCGICFEHKSTDRKLEAEYIAPDLLPQARPDEEIEQKWDENAPSESVTFAFDLLPSTLMRSLIARVGAQAGLSGDYWKTGLYLYERDSSSRALIEQDMRDDWQGCITIRTQKGQAARLLQSLSEVLEEESQRFGLQFTTEEERPRREEEKEAKLEDLKFGQESADRPEYFVSYAWRDDKTRAGRRREVEVDRLCAESETQKGIKILRDKNVLDYGDSIAKFMTRIGAGERIFVFLSDKYLKSPNCMFELSEIWRNAGQDEDELSRRIRVYTLDDANIWSIPGRLEYAAHWEQEFQELDEAVRTYGAKLLPAKDAEVYRKIHRFADIVGDVLSAIADRVQPRSFEDFMKYGFDDLDEAEDDADPDN